jgi:NADH dehydrogenase
VKLRVAITGAGGFLGSALTRRLLAAGVEVQGLTRRPLSLPGVQWQAYELGGPLPAPTFFENVDAIVHAAFGQGAAGPALEQMNCAAAQELLAAARRHGRHFVFISSMSAHAGAASSYGRAKWSIEQTLDPAVDAIVRPGLIIGPGGVFARMQATLHRAPVIPLFYGGTQPVQPVGLDDVVAAVEQILRQRLAGCFNLGSATPITIRQLYERMLAAAGRRRPLLPLPSDLTVLALRAAERLGLTLPLTAENLLGQKHLRMFETTSSFARLGLTPTPLDQLPWGLPPATP